MRPAAAAAAACARRCVPLTSPRPSLSRYIQDKVEEYSDDIFDRLDTGAHIYFCGLKGMMPGIQDMLKEVCKGRDIDYDEWLGGLKTKKQWHVEVY